MSSRKPVPASIRYIKARLRFLTRPAFWGSSVVLLLVMLFAWQYFTNPDSLKAIGNDQETGNEQVAGSSNSDDSTPSPKDLAAIGADIDSSSVLKKELEKVNTKPAINIGNPQSQAGQPEGLFDQFSREQAAAYQTNQAPPTGITFPSTSETQRYKQNTSNPFAASAQELLNSGLIGSDRYAGVRQDSSAAQSIYKPMVGARDVNSADQNQSSTPLTGVATYNPFLGVNNSNSVNQNQSPTAISPLETALKQTIQPNSAPSAETQGLANTSGQTLSTSAYTGSAGVPLVAPVTPNTTGYSLPPNANTPNSPNPYSNSTQPQSVQLVPAAAPIVPPAAPVTPSYTSSYTPSYTPSYSVPYQPQSAPQPTGVTNSPYTSPFGNQGASSNQGIPPVYTFPGQNSGQNNGGNKTNTFSNP